MTSSSEKPTDLAKADISSGLWALNNFCNSTNMPGDSGDVCEVKKWYHRCNIDLVLTNKRLES